MTHLLKVFTIFLMLLCITSLASNVYAQDGSFSPQHIKLNNSAAEATKQGKYDEAIRLLNNSLELGEFNITYLNLGRVYALAGKCQQALEAYDKMLIAPRITGHTPETLYEKLVEYRADLKKQCPGKVTFRCQPRNIEISINGQDRQPCPSQPVELMPGEYTFEGYNEDVHTKTQTEVIGQNIIYVDLVALPKEKHEKVDNKDLTVLKSNLKISGWTFTSIGIASIIVASTVLAHTETVLRKDYENATQNKSSIATTINERTFMTYAFFGAGAGFLISGATILILDALTSPSLEEKNNKLSFSILPNQASMKLNF